MEIKYRGGIQINYAKCTGCGKCYEVCPMDIFSFDPVSRLVTVAYSDECWYCGSCILDCPVEGALSLEIPLACL